MKKILSILLGITLAVSSSIAFAADTTTIWLTKTSSDNMVKVTTDKSTLGTVKIKFADDATWASAKDSYDVSPTTADAIAKGGCITVHGDGGISVSCPVKKAPKAAKESTKAPAPAAATAPVTK